MKKLARAAGLAADLAPGATAILAGVAVIVGALTGVLWL